MQLIKLYHISKNPDILKYLKHQMLEGNCLEMLDELNCYELRGNAQRINAVNVSILRYVAVQIVVLVTLRDEKGTAHTVNFNGDVTVAMGHDGHAYMTADAEKQYMVEVMRRFTDEVEQLDEGTAPGLVRSTVQ